MLKYISPLLSPDLLKTLCEMGHGDEIVLADCNFPAESHNGRVIRLDAHSGTEVLKAVMTVFPLDTYADNNAVFMQKVKGDDLDTPIWEEYEKILYKAEGSAVKTCCEERFAFYERVKRAYAVIATGETSLYANLILRKGVITDKPVELSLADS